MKTYLLTGNKKYLSLIITTDVSVEEIKESVVKGTKIIDITNLNKEEQRKVLLKEEKKNGKRSIRPIR